MSTKKKMTIGLDDYIKANKKLARNFSVMVGVGSLKTDRIRI